MLPKSVNARMGVMMTRSLAGHGVFLDRLAQAVNFVPLGWDRAFDHPGPIPLIVNAAAPRGAMPGQKGRRSHQPGRLSRRVPDQRTWPATSQII